jgi:uncharacterized protein (UPF0305 family)
MAKKERIKDILNGARVRVDKFGQAETKRIRDAFVKQIFRKYNEIINDMKNKMEEQNKNV